MPNWCYNNATFSHEDSKEIQRLAKAYNEGKFFNEFVPMPPELLEEAPTGDGWQERQAEITKRNAEQFGYSSWYDWAVSNWGTKWEPDTDGMDNVEVAEGDTSVDLSFDTAWAPPIEFYREMSDMGFTITAYYNEEGMAFCGKYTTEDDDEVYEYGDMSADEIRENVPSDIDEAFGISDLIADMADEEDIFDMDDAEDSDHEVESE